MSEDKEKISAWLDDAIEYRETDSLEVELSERGYSTTARYQMIGDALRGRVTDASMVDISSSVRAAIQREPDMVPVNQPVRSAPRQDRPLFDFGAWLRPVGGLAVAATVAMVMVVTLTDQQTGTENAVVADNVAQQPLRTIPVNNAVPVYKQPAMALPAVNLNSYVARHSEFAAQDTLQAIMPYARSVGYGSENNSQPTNIYTHPPLVNNPGK